MSATIPEVSGGHPIIGHMGAFLRDPLGLLRRAQRECGDIAAFHLGPRRVVLLTGPGLHEVFFRASDEQLSQRDAYQLMIPVFGPGVVYDAPPERMIEQFHFLIPALQERRMRTYATLIAAEVDDAVADWGDAGTVDVYPFTRSLVGKTSTRCLLGPEFRHELTDEFESTYADLEGGVKPLAYVAPNLPTPAFRRRDRARRDLQRLVGNVIERRRKDGVAGEDFLQTMMDASYADGSRPNEHEITGLLLAAMFAGRDTSSASAAWALVELARNGADQARLRAEIDQARASLADAPIAALPAVDRFLKEVLRLHPPLFILLRRVIADLEIGGVRVPRGSLVAVSPTVAHGDSRVFQHPDRFDPDRFGPARAEDRRPFAYIPFGGGRHKCMGTAFAMLQLRTIIDAILSSYELDMADDPVEADYGVLVIGPKVPLRLRYRRRGTAATNSSLPAADYGAAGVPHDAAV